MFIKITNPYEVPVDIVSAETVVPVEFYNSKDRPKSFMKTLLSIVKRETMEKLEADRIGAQVLRGVPVQPSADAAPAAQTTRGGTVRLQPGNATLYEFQLRTRKTLFFTPAVYNLHMQVQYRMDALLNHDTVKYQLNVSAPLKAMIWGAVLGAIIGSLLRDLYRTKTATDTTWFSGDLPLTAISGVLVGAVLVIAFARKKDAQPFISIEDFYGGFFVGFVAGYVGKPLLDELLPDKARN